MGMTQQYLIGELSLRLAQLQALVADQESVHDLVRLRRLAEAAPVAELASITTCAIELVDDLCWDAVARGDVAAFGRESAAAAELYEFGVCAGLLEEG
jgi:hypothetical protein